MLKWRIIKFICVLFIAVSSTGCALGLIDKALGDKKAAHADDQDVNIPVSNSNNFSKDVQ